MILGTYTYRKVIFGPNSLLGQFLLALLFHKWDQVTHSFLHDTSWLNNLLNAVWFVIIRCASEKRIIKLSIISRSISQSVSWSLRQSVLPSRVDLLFLPEVRTFFLHQTDLQPLPCPIRKQKSQISFNGGSSTQIKSSIIRYQDVPPFSFLVFSNRLRDNELWQNLTFINGPSITFNGRGYLSEHCLASSVSSITNLSMP